MDHLKYTEILQLNKSLAGKISGKPYQIGILSNVTVNSFKEVLEYACRLQNIEPEVEIGNFDNIVQDSATFHNKDLVVIFYDLLNIADSVSGFFEDISDQTYQDLREKLCAEIDIILGNLSQTASVVFNSFSAAPLAGGLNTATRLETLSNELNQYLQNKKSSNVSVLNIDKVYSRIGVKQAIDFRFYNSSKAPYTLLFYKSYLPGLEHIILRNTGRLKKAIIFDCDNTLWKGIIGEDGMEGIDMAPSSAQGKYYQRVQQIAVYLSKRGVIVGLCSKNNEEDVLEVLRTHPDAFIKEEHIVLHKINWQDKASNLRAMATDLNIGLDSFVFVDDSNFEINLIKDSVPEILTIQVPTAISEYPDILLANIYKYFNLNLTADDAKKTEMYKQQFQRENAKNAFASIDDYLASLQIELKILKDDTSYIPRIAQLTQKTNQFNLTTIRYTEGQIEQFMKSDKAEVFAMFVKDKFGDSGLTGVCIVKQDESNPTNVVIDSLLMSCRILGRKIEFVYVNTIIEHLAMSGYKSLSAQYIPTKKNAQVENFYDQVGLDPIPAQGSDKRYQLSMKDFKKMNVDYIKVIHDFEKIKN